MAKRKVILDVDTGSDDAIALIAAMANPECRFRDIDHFQPEIRRHGRLSFGRVCCPRSPGPRHLAGLPRVSGLSPFPARSAPLIQAKSFEAFRSAAAIAA